jgi:hypothetical protein
MWSPGAFGEAKSAKKITPHTVHASNMLPPSWPILLLGVKAIAKWIDYSDSGPASMTHYTLPLDFVAACGCTGESTHYPTAALSQMAYGSSVDYGAHIFIISCRSMLIFILGPACGKCFNLTLLNPVIATPMFYPSVVKHIVVKVTDLCPRSRAGYCSGTNAKPNS